MKAKIPFYGIDRFYKRNSQKIDALVKKVLKTGILIDGHETKTLEKELAEYCGRQFCTMNSSGTDSLFFAFKALGINKNDEILVPAISFIASATAISRAGGIPVFVDVNTTNALMDLADAEKKLSSKTKAILFVDLFGNMPHVDLIEAFAKKHHLFLIEDAAQSIGSGTNNRKAGSMGDVSIFSFDPSKPVSAFGTGGAVLCNNSGLINKCVAYRQNGKNPGNALYDSFGINSHVSEIQSALINLQLMMFEQELLKRKHLANMYLDLLHNWPLDILVNDQFNSKGNFHKFVIKTNLRNELKKFLSDKGIETRIHYDNCLYDYPVLNKYKNYCPNAEALKTQVLSLPFYTDLKESEITFICRQIKTFVKC